MAKTPKQFVGLGQKKPPPLQGTPLKSVLKNKVGLLNCKPCSRTNKHCGTVGSLLVCSARSQVMGLAARWVLLAVPLLLKGKNKKPRSAQMCLSARRCWISC